MIHLSYICLTFNIMTNSVDISGLCANVRLITASGSVIQKSLQQVRRLGLMSLLASLVGNIDIA